MPSEAEFEAWQEFHRREAMVDRPYYPCSICGKDSDAWGEFEDGTWICYACDMEQCDE